MPTRTRQVMIVGGGVAALETLLALRDLAGHRVALTMLSAEREFLYRPVTVAEAFDRGEARAYSLPQIIGERERDRFIWGALRRVDPGEYAVETSAGQRLHFDTLVIATGARSRDWLPGALTFHGRADVGLMRRLLADLLAHRAGSLALTLPPEQIWPLPVYELAMLTATRLRERGAFAAKLSLVTPEAQPLELFGAEADRVVRPLLERLGVRLHTSSTPALVQGRELVLVGGNKIHADRVVTVGMPAGPRLPGLPHDERGFIPVDGYGRVAGLQDIYAAGDATTFPLKQGGLAAQQADAVAETIAAELGIPVRGKRFRPVLRGLLLTGGPPLYLRAEDGSSAASEQPLWWPPVKVAGRHLGPFLAGARPLSFGGEVLSDRAEIQGTPLDRSEHDEALQLVLTMAEADASRRDFVSALTALEAAEALEGMLAPELEAKRRQWRLAARSE